MWNNDIEQKTEQMLSWTHIGIKLIVFSGEHNLPQVFADAWDSGQVYAVVVQTQKLMNHGLICPLKKQKAKQLTTTLVNHRENTNE